MSTHGILLLDLIGFMLLAAVVDLVRRRVLQVAYGVVWLMAILVMIAVVSVPSLLRLVTAAVGATYPASALTLLAFALAFVVLIFISAQLSRLSARQVALAQAMALSDLKRREDATEPGEWRR
jgi:hypothetical protein